MVSRQTDRKTDTSTTAKTPEALHAVTRKNIKKTVADEQHLMHKSYQAINADWLLKGTDTFDLE